MDLGRRLWKKYFKKKTNGNLGVRKPVKHQSRSQGRFPGLRVGQGKGPGNEVGKTLE